MLADRLRGRPAILHHHDPPWQRQRYAHVTELPPDDPMWAHVTINKLTEAQFADRGLRAITIYNGFDLSPPAGDRSRTRAALEVAEDEWLVAHPVRAIARKNIPAAVELCRRLPATYWLPGDVEEGFGETLDRLLTNARCRVIRRPVDAVDITMPDLYAASDLVVFPSWWEGFGNPPIEAAIHRRPAAVGRYPVADELRSLGFRWLDPTDAPAVAKALIDQPTADLEFNRRVVEEHLSLPTMTESIARLLEARGWQP
jgi:glycosyltransferase involved in cell wall biosynthesis